MREKTSVLMSVYHKEQASFFDLSLKSILIDQTEKPDEFVLVCDGPLTEELNVVIDKYLKLFPEVLKVFRTEENRGLGNALNFGLRKCSNSIIIRADSDDVCVPERIATQLDYMNSHPDISVVSSYIDEFCDDFLEPINTKKLPLEHDEIVKMAKFRNPINHMAVAFRKDTICKIGSYHHVPYVEDYELWLRTIINGYKLANIGRVLVHARIGNGMIIRRGNKQYVRSWKTINDLMLRNKMINRLEYFRNTILIRGFVSIPSALREWVYKRLLRRGYSK